MTDHPCPVLQPHCPVCNGLRYRVIYLGLPMSLCADEECAHLWGFWSWVPRIDLFFNGAFMAYLNSYPTALWHWLRGGETE